MDVLGTEHIFRVYRLHPHGDSHKRQLAGRFLVYQGTLHILEDYFGTLHTHLTEGPVTPATDRSIKRLSQSSYYDVVTDADIRDGQRLDLIPEETEFGDPAAEANAIDDESGATNGQRPSIFSYARQGMEPQTIEFRDGNAYMAGNQLSPEELQRIVDHSQTGVATLTYKP